MNSKAHLSILLFLGVFFNGLTVCAFHPLVTDDTGTLGMGRFQYELSVDCAQDKGKGVRTKELSVNNTFTYGPLNVMDIAIAVPYLYLKEENGETFDHRGFSDVEIVLKYRFYEEHGLRLALRPSIIVPTGNEKKGLGSGRVGGKVFLLADKELGKITGFFNLGYIRNGNSVGERKDLWHVSMAGGYGVSEKLKVVGNVGVERNPEKGASVPKIFLIGGVVYSLSQEHDLSAALKRGLTRPERTGSITAGITFRF